MIMHYYNHFTTLVFLKNYAAVIYCGGRALPDLPSSFIHSFTNFTQPKASPHYYTEWPKIQLSG